MAPGGETLNETWDGFLNTQTQWSGSVAGTVSRTFDDNFRVTALAVNGQSTAYAYDADGLLTQAGGLTLTRDAGNGRVTGTALGTLTTARTYDGFGALASLNAASSTTPLYQASYTRDADNRVTQMVETVNGIATNWQYGYDARGRLISVSANGSPVSTYGYDANGNRVSVNGQTLATYNADDQLTSYNGTPYTYASDGSLSGVGSTTYRYDALGHLLEVKTPAADITYTYDGLGRRVGKSINGTLVQGFLYANGINPIAQLDGQGNVVAAFVYGTRPNVPDLMLKGGVTYRIISNQLGSPVEVINTGTGAIAEQITYDAWGNITSDSSPGFQPFGFAGGLYDADTGLVHFGARDYDPVTGRWTTRDPLSFGGGDANLYGYVLQDPVNLIDLYGAFALPMLNQGFVDFTAGFGDSLVKALTFGYGDLAATRQALGIDGANECSAFYHSGAASGAAYGVGLDLAALAYAPVAIASSSIESGRAALLAAALYTGQGGGELASYIAAQDAAAALGQTIQYDVTTTTLWLSPK